jgi:hypothetical protein
VLCDFSGFLLKFLNRIDHLIDVTSRYFADHSSMLHAFSHEFERKNCYFLNKGIAPILLFNSGL